MAGTPEAETVIEARGLVKRYGEVEAVRGIDLAIHRGEVYGLLGPNGAGKTTTIKMLVTLLPPTDGTASVGGADVVHHPGRVRKRIGIVFQEPSIDTLLTGRENLLLHAKLYGVPPQEREARMAELLELVDLTDRADSPTKTYSGGMKRRLEIARGLLHRPEVLFLDEPTLGLDPQTREHIWAYIQGLKREHRTTIVLTTHYMEEADALCDRIGIIDHGRIVAEDTPRALKGELGGDVVTLHDVPGGEDLAALPFVRNVDRRGRDLVLTVQDATVDLPRILKAAGEVGGVEVHRPTLNDVFLHHTGHDLRQEAGEDFYQEMARFEAAGG